MTEAKLLRTLLIGMTLGLLGCGKGGDSYSGPTGTIGGQVMWNKKPLPAGTNVAFNAAKGNFVATAQTDAEGKYQLKWKGNPQIPVGAYAIAVTGAPAGGTTDPDELMKMSQAGTLPKDPNPIPTKYTSPGTSELKFEVKEGANTFDIVLK